MTSRANTIIPLFGILSLLVSFHACAGEPVDADAAIKLARSQNCLRCHAVAKKKEGPSYASVAKKYREDQDAEKIVFEVITESPRMRMSDGHKEAHRAVQNTSKEQIMNLVRWILAQEANGSAQQMQDGLNDAIPLNHPVATTFSTQSEPGMHRTNADSN